MLSVLTSINDQILLDALCQHTGLSPSDIATLALRGTLAHFALHGTLTLLTPDTKECHGCRFLKHQLTEAEDESPPIPNLLKGPW